MPELIFKGKEFVRNHHLSVPHHPLVARPDKSVGDNSENLIIHGDNLIALKALLPRYAGKVDCIFIDPPYNTGTTEWRYSDRVDSPLMIRWLKENPVNSEDMLRHDKWSCMIYPRLKLLYELLSEETGILWISIDDGEQHHVKMMLNEIFGEESFIGQFVWKSRVSEDTRAKTGISTDHEYVLCFRKGELERLRGAAKDLSKFSNPDNDPRGPWRSADLTGLATMEQRPNLHYDLVNPDSKVNYGCPPKGWRYAEDVIIQKISEKRVLWPPAAIGRPRHKLFLNEMKSKFKNISTIITHTSTSDGTKELNDIMGTGAFDFPKPTKLLELILEQSTDLDALVLDSFAGSGTTAHAVLSQNEKDGGNRKFVLVECEKYADELTAERVRRVINGYRFRGNQKEDLLREKITWTKFKNATTLLHEIEGIENLESGRFDQIKTEIKDGELIVTGENKIAERVEGLGGGFTYCTLGDAVDLDKMLTGKSLPSFEAIGSWLFYTATGENLKPSSIKEKKGYLGESSSYHVWLLYEPNLEWLVSSEAALTLSGAESISKQRKDKPHLVFSAATYVPGNRLRPLRVEHAPLPFALFRHGGE